MPIDWQDVVYKQGLYTSFFISTAPQGATVYRVDQKVLSGVSIPSYGKPEPTFWPTQYFHFIVGSPEITGARSSLRRKWEI